MTTSFSLAPVPKWYIADLVGKPLAGGYMATFSSLNHTQFKAVYEDPAGMFPWPYVTIPNVGSLGILFDENGSQGPFYFKFDSTTPADLYYIEIYDFNGVLQWTIDNFTGVGSGGGGTITEALDLENLVPNNVMYRNTGPTVIDPGTFTVLAPGANAGLVKTASLAGPDICFIKNNASATDRISFPKFTLGSTALTGDVTPVDYLHFVCSGAGAGETSKYVQFPITQGCQNLTNQAVTVTIWARCTSGNTSLTLYFLQFYGDGAGASASTRFAIQTLTLTSSWQKFTMQTTVPDATGKVIGGCNNDGLFLQVEYPLDATTTIDFTKPCVFLGTISPDQQYQTYDAIDGVIDTARTGDIITSIRGDARNGWVPMNDGTIGNSSSNAVTRAADDTFPLFDLLWVMLPFYVPMYDSAGTLQSRGASSVADYTANRQISLTKSLGQVMAGSTNALPTNDIQTYTVNHLISNSNLAVTNAVVYGTGTPVTLTSTGAPPAGLSVSTLYYSIYVDATHIQLTTNPGNLTPITFTDDGSGVNSINSVTNGQGVFAGESSHTMTINEMVSHNHPGSTAAVPFQSPGGASHVTSAGTSNANDNVTANVAFQGGGTPFNIVQPTTYVNVFIKL